MNRRTRGLGFGQFFLCKHRSVLAIGFLAAASLGVAARGDTSATWTSGSSGNWSSAASWSTNPNYPNNGTPAGINYTATISNPVTVTVDTPVTIDGLTLSGSAQVTGGGTFGTVNMSGNSNFTVNGALSNSTFNMSSSASVTATGTPTYDNVSFSQPVDPIPVNGGANVGGNASFGGGSATIQLGFTFTFVGSSPVTLDNINVSTGSFYSSLTSLGAPVTFGSGANISGIISYNWPAASAPYPIINNGTITTLSSNTAQTFIGGSTFTNNGTLILASEPATVIQPTTSFINNGTINFDGGLLQMSTLPVGSGTITGNGGSTGTIQGSGGSKFLMNFYGTQRFGSYNDYLQATNIDLGGTLQVDLQSGALAHISPSATYLILLGTSGISGSFANVGNGGRVVTTDGTGSFVVNIGSDQVTLSNFESVPEPASLGLLIAGGVGLLSRRQARN
jgi:hypothetical protein